MQEQHPPNDPLQPATIVAKQHMPQDVQFPQIMRTHKTKCIKIDNGNWKSLNMGYYCQYIAEWNVDDMLFLNKNLHAGIVRDISSIHFARLGQLYLAGNLIQSIQAIAHLQAPGLQVIWMHDNLITSIKPLRKASFPKLAYIRLTQNYICDSGQLNDAQINLPSSLMLDYNRFGRVQFEDLRALAKYRYTNQQNYGLYGFSSERIYQKGLIEALKRRIATESNFGFHYLFLQ